MAKIREVANEQLNDWPVVFECSVQVEFETTAAHLSLHFWDCHDSEWYFYEPLFVSFISLELSSAKGFLKQTQAQKIIALKYANYSKKNHVLWRCCPHMLWGAVYCPSQLCRICCWAAQLGDNHSAVTKPSKDFRHGQSSSISIESSMDAKERPFVNLCEWNYEIVIYHSERIFSLYLFFLLVNWFQGNW